MSTTTFALDMPALDGRPVTERHARFCAERGHATHSVDGEVRSGCPRCGEVVAPARPTFQIVTWVNRNWDEDGPQESGVMLPAELIAEHGLTHAAALAVVRWAREPVRPCCPASLTILGVRDCEHADKDGRIDPTTGERGWTCCRCGEALPETAEDRADRLRLEADEAACWAEVPDYAKQ